MELMRAEPGSVTARREERRRALDLGIVPAFYGRLAGEAQTQLLVEDDPTGSARTLGYVLTVERAHDGHNHVTVIELHLTGRYRDRYEDALDVVRDGLHPTAYLTRTDDCRYNAALLSRGLQVEPTALVMLWSNSTPGVGSPSESGLLRDLVREHMSRIETMLAGDEDADALADLEAMVGSGRAWAVVEDGRPVAVIARRDGGDGTHELLDFALARAPESGLAEAMRQAAARVRGSGLAPAAVIDASEAARRRIFRQAGFHTEASYMVYYDPEAGRPSVSTVTTEEMRALVDAGAKVRIVDVLGEEHWRSGHIPGSEWIDFKGLGRKAKERFRDDEAIIVYCSGYT